MESTVVWHFYTSSLFQTCFIVFVTYLLYSKTPKQVFFFNPIKYILTSFTTLYLLFYNYTFFRLTFKIYIFTGSLTKMALEGMMDASEDVENSPAMKQAEKSILDVQNVLSILLELVNQITLTLSTIAAGGEGGVLGKKI